MATPSAPARLKSAVSLPSVSSEKPCEQRLTAETRSPRPLSSSMSRTMSRVFPLSEKPTTATIFIAF